MSVFRWLTSPLTATAGVMAGLALISLPLRQLTSAPPVALPEPVVLEATETSAVLRLRLLAPAARVVVTPADGHPVLEIDNAPAGESEHDVALALDHGGADLELSVEDSSADGETAAFLTVMPDGREEQTRFAIGAGDFGEMLRFEWPHTH